MKKIEDGDIKEVGQISLKIRDKQMVFELEGSMLTSTELEAMMDELVRRDLTIEDMKNRFKPEWHMVFENFYVNDTIGIPTRIIQTEYYDLDTCKKICDIMNELNVSYIANLLNSRRSETFWHEKYEKAYKENRQLKDATIHKIINNMNVLDDFMDILNKIQADPTNEKNLNVARDMLQNMDMELL